ISRWGGVACGSMAAAYLTFGAVQRARRLRKKADEIDPIARRWLHIGGVVMALPLVGATVWAIRDMSAFAAGGFRPFIAIAMVGGAACLVLAMTRTPFGELDRVWRRSSGYLLATLLAAAVYLALIGLLGGTASALSGGDFQAALAATLGAAVLFGPMRLYLQRVVDERFARDRSRARTLLSEAAKAAAATLDLEPMQAGVVHRVRTALSARGAAIYFEEDGDWTRVALAGEVELHDLDLPRHFRRALEARAARDLTDEVIALPIPLDDGCPGMLVVARRDALRFDEEERELLATVAAQLVVAVGNGRAHRRLQDLTERLQQEVELSERRRKEIARLKDLVEEENRALIGQLASRSGKAPVIGTGLAATFDLVQKVAHTETNVLVRGETGVGKELVARAVHAGSARRDGPFIVVDCGAIAQGVCESALFGHERGAFTGAVRAAQGAFRAASGGTIFLDELGELPLDLQPKLLRVLQEREVHPVGADQPVAVDVRVIAGTNRELAEEVALGNFRQDLLYRLQVVEIQVPPLRARRGDIPALAEHFVALHAERAGRSPRRLMPDAITALVEHDWPGNVRELENALEAAAVYAEGDEIRAADLPVFEQVFRSKGKRAISENGIKTVTDDGAPRIGLRETLEDLERDRLIESLRQHEGNRTRTARALGMSRGALLRRIKRYDIEELAS
ncbi:MAG TPA: sigma 54-interacting transcriptional regulator, partial [Kofleriaceae bacterium]|nr:sigma 54-interacting transcriptional regulator [Kofleriaceae bacterium]